MNKKSDNISHGKPSAGLNPLKASQPSDSAKIRTDVEETKFDIGNGLIVTVRASAHNADAGNYTKDGKVQAL